MNIHFLLEGLGDCFFDIVNNYASLRGRGIRNTFLTAVWDVLG